MMHKNKVRCKDCHQLFWRKHLSCPARNQGQQKGRTSRVKSTLPDCSDVHNSGSSADTNNMKPTKHFENKEGICKDCVRIGREQTLKEVKVIIETILKEDLEDSIKGEVPYQDDGNVMCFIEELIEQLILKKEIEEMK